MYLHVTVDVEDGYYPGALNSDRSLKKVFRNMHILIMPRPRGRLNGSQRVNKEGVFITPRYLTMPARLMGLDRRRGRGA